VRNRASLFQFGTTSADNLNSSYVFFGANIGRDDLFHAAYIRRIELCTLISLLAFAELAFAHPQRELLFKRPSLYWKTLGHGPILAPLTFWPRRLHKYYNPAAPWLVALNQINMQARTTKETQHS
jgi:hypothetical protein